MTDRPSVSNILIVDDEPSNLLALEAILEPLGHQLIRAASGVEALKHALKHELCVILMDVQMPEMDGFEAVELLRKRPKTRDIPVIFLTAISKDRKFISRGYDVGAVDYLFKPYEPDVLRSKVSVFVELAKKNTIIREQAEELRLLSERELADFKKRSEQRYADLADSMPEIVWTADAYGTVRYGNRRWNELGEGSSDFAAIVHPEDLDAFLEGWRTAIAQAKAWEAELRLGNPERGYCFHLVRAVPRIEDGRIEGWIGTGTEIDARVRAERALRLLADASRRLGASLDEPSELDAVLESTLPQLGDAAVLDLRDGNADEKPARRVVAVHPADAAVVDDPRFDLGPSTVAYSHRPEIYLDVEAEMEATHSGRGAENIRFLSELRVSGYMCLPLTSRQRTIGTLTFVRLAGGRYESADVSVAEDLASRIAVAIENVRLHETTEKRREELELANKSKDVFLATLSHELRTPLNAIVGWTDMMKNGALRGDELQRAFDTIDRNAHALNGLVADLLDVSRIVTDTLKLDSKVLSLASVVEAAIEAARPQATVKQVNLDVSLERAGCVRGDGGRLRQVVANLLSNAIKFTPAGGTIVVRIERERVSDGRDVARIVVKDSGEGIAPEFLPHVFERFRQAETGRARGLGLGLAIVKHLVQAHGGTVDAESAGRGQGASFAVTLPIESDEVAPGEDESRVSRPPAGQPKLENLHILVVEDDPDGNELITTILERYGARVTSVGTATAALAALDAETPNVLVSDIGLPDKDGIELIKQVRAKAALASLPAIALTAYASRQDAAKALAAGFDAHVAKPVQPGTLGTAVARLMTRDAKPSTAA